ncbi:hypothetical protein MM182_08635 [Aeromonas sp. MR19]|jgi:hypothetical protein|uniref:hypothetical protein n=1 Tax=Aeromonas sp. MR19 TaxID=2923421 RepID=UPI001F4A89B4|nr:hypothetical protein [Aeromonas sp. MR19]MCH7375447.1 hypothetical protein [Aeromonas sp. MR19]
MKAIMLALLLPVGLSAAEQDYRIVRDEWVDGKIDKATSSSSTIIVNLDGNIISPGRLGGDIKGEFMEGNKLFQLKQNVNESSTYYLGKMIAERQYQGVWYDMNGREGDFRIEWGEEENPDCRLATETGWYHNLYCNADIDGGGWRLVAVRFNKDPHIPVDKLTSLTSNQYLNPGAWAQLKDESTEILFMQPNTKLWGIMSISQASNPAFCSPLDNNLSKAKIVHAEKSGCNTANLDYTVVGHPSSRDNQGSFYGYKKDEWSLGYPNLWVKSNWHPKQQAAYSNQLMVFVR